MERILVTIPAEDDHKALFESIMPDAAFTYAQGADVTDEMIQDATIIIGNVPPARINGSPNLKWIQLNSAGTDGFTAPGVLPEGCLLTNATGAYGLALSEHMLAMLLAMIKKLPLYWHDQSAHIWGDNGQVRSIYGSTTLVIGLGDIGGEFAKRMNALGSRVYGIRAHKAPKPDYLEGLYTMDALEELLPQADYVFSALPGTKATYKIFNAKTFGLMKKGAIFLNIGRGTAVDTDALIEACETGHLGGACVDVTDPEPLPEKHLLWGTRNVMITPHISGFYHLHETLVRIVHIAADNLAAFRDGKELKNLVDFTTGYRKFQG